MNGFEPINLCDIAIAISAYFAIYYTFLEANVWLHRITAAIRKNDLTWAHAYSRTALFYTLLIISILIRIRL